MKIAEELEARGYTDGHDAFEEVVIDTFASLFPSWSIETLLEHPYESLDFCKHVMEKINLTGPRKEVAYLICRVLVNNRKNRGNKLRGMGV